MMRDAILAFAKQFAYEPIIEGGSLPEYSRIIVGGMGGSHLAADILSALAPHISIQVWSDYGLPFTPEQEREKTLLIASSYSGNTEESIDAYEAAGASGMPRAVIAVGGKLIELAKRDQIPYIQLPNTGIQPRSALGFSLRALMRLLSLTELEEQARRLSSTLNVEELESVGQALATRLINRVPVIYASRANSCIAYNWKIKLNETGKIPAFYNLVPELNHNEMTGFDVVEATKSLSSHNAFIFLKDSEDHARNRRRMEIMAKLYQDRDLPVHEIDLQGHTKMEKIFRCLVLADWIAVAIAAHYGLESEQVPMVEEFKKAL